MNKSQGFWAIAVAAGMALSACARLDDAGMFVLASNMEAVAIVAGQVVQGEVMLLPDRTGNVKLSAEKGMLTSCMGLLRFTAHSAGNINLRCNDSSTVDLDFTLLTPTSGYAFGTTPAGPASLTFGLQAPQARAYLTVPANKKLVERGGTPMFELQ